MTFAELQAVLHDLDRERRPIVQRFKMSRETLERIKHAFRVEPAPAAGYLVGIPLIEDPTVPPGVIRFHYGDRRTNDHTLGRADA